MATAVYEVTAEEEEAFWASLRPSPEEEAAEREAYDRRADFEAWANAEVDRMVAEIEEEEAPEGVSLPGTDGESWEAAYAANARREPIRFLSPRKGYDPGTPGTVEMLGNYREGRFLVGSWREAGASYCVDLCEGTCTCPHHQFRLAPKIEGGEEVTPCKHFDMARQESRRIALEIAHQLSAENLRRQMTRTDLRPEIHTALREVMWERMNTRPGSLPLAALITTACKAAA